MCLSSLTSSDSSTDKQAQITEKGRVEGRPGAPQSKQSRIRNENVLGIECICCCKCKGQLSPSKWEGGVRGSKVSSQCRLGISGSKCRRSRSVNECGFIERRDASVRATSPCRLFSVHTTGDVGGVEVGGV